MHAEDHKIHALKDGQVAGEVRSKISQQAAILFSKCHNCDDNNKNGSELEESELVVDDV